MAKIGLYYPVYAKIEKEEYGVAPTYGTGDVIGKAITAEKTINFNDNPLYADGTIAENDRSFSDGSIKFGVADIGLKTTADLLGAKYTEKTETEPEKIIRAGGNIAPYCGVGYYKKGVDNNIPYYEGTWLLKTQFSPFGESAKTKEKSIEWQTPEIEGSIMIVDGYEEGAYEETVRFATETEVREWLNTKANITTAQG